METYYKPLTPSLRQAIDKGLDDAIAELQSCQANTLSTVQISALQKYKRLIHGLPDGFPMPIRK